MNHTKISTKIRKKTIVFNSCLLEKSENFLNFTKISNNGEFLNFREFSYAFLNFLEIQENLTK